MCKRRSISLYFGLRIPDHRLARGLKQGDRRGKSVPERNRGVAVGEPLDRVYVAIKKTWSPQCSAHRNASPSKSISILDVRGMIAVSRSAVRKPRFCARPSVVHPCVGIRYTEHN